MTGKAASRPKIEIAYLIPSLGTGGAEKITLNLQREFADSDIDITVLYWEGRNDLLRHSSFLKAKVHRFEFRKVVSLRSILMLYRYLKKKKISLLHTHLMDADLIGFIAAKLAFIPHVVTIHSYPFPAMRRHRLRYRLMTFFSTRIVCVSDLVMRHVLKSTGIPQNRTTVIHNGIDLPKYLVTPEEGEKTALRKELGIPAGARIIGTVGRLVMEKGQIYLVEAVPEIIKKCPDAFFLIIGDGNQRPVLESRARELDIDKRIIFAGARTDIPPLLSIMELFVFPTLHEALGIAVIEAMAMGKPIVTTNCSAIPELIENGREGILVPPENTPALAEALIDLYHDSGKKAFIAGEAAKKALNFSISLTARKLKNLYKALLQKTLNSRAVITKTGTGMQILYLHNHETISGGEQSLLNLWRHLDRNRYAPLLVIPAPGPLAAEAGALGVPVIFFPVPKIAPANIFAVILAFLRLVLICRQRKVGLIHSYSPRNNILAACVGRIFGIPAVWHERNLTYGKERDISRAFIFLPDRIVCNSKAVAARFMKNGAIPPKVSVIMNGVDLDRFGYGPASPGIMKTYNPGGRPVVGLVSNLSRRKGADLFIDIAKIVRGKMDGVLFMIIGGEFTENDCGRRAGLEQRIASEGLAGSFIITGFVSNVHEVLPLITVGAAITEKEACSRAILEMMACAKPVAAFGTGGNAELIEHGVTGFLYPLNDLEAISGGILYLLENPGKAREMGMAGRSRAAGLFDVRTNAVQTMEVYRNLTEGGKE